MKSVSYILACYNEEEIIENTVKECHAALMRDFQDFEIILVDDASRDNTREIMDRLSEELSNIRVLHNLINLNFGASVLRGLKLATKDVVMFNAADLPFSPNLTKSVVERMDDCELLVLEREEYHGTGWRKLTSSVNILLLHLLFPKLMKGTPVVNFIQVFRREIVDTVMPLARSPIFVWPEMIFRAKLNDRIRVLNMRVPINSAVVRKGAFGKPHDIIWGIYDIIRFRIRRWLENE